MMSRAAIGSLVLLPALWHLLHPAPLLLLSHSSPSTLVMLAVGWRVAGSAAALSALSEFRGLELLVRAPPIVVVLAGVMQAVGGLSAFALLRRANAGVSACAAAGLLAELVSLLTPLDGSNFLSVTLLPLILFAVLQAAASARRGGRGRWPLLITASLLCSLAGFRQALLIDLPPVLALVVIRVAVIEPNLRRRTIGSLAAALACGCLLSQSVRLMLPPSPPGHLALRPGPAAFLATGGGGTLTARLSGARLAAPARVVAMLRGLGAGEVLVPRDSEPFTRLSRTPVRLDRSNLPHPLSPGAFWSLPLDLPREACPTDIVALTIVIGTYRGHSDGDLDLSVCVGDRCQAATATLVGAADNAGLTFRLDAPLTVAPGERPVARFIHRGGTIGVALYVWPSVETGQPDGPLVTFTLADPRLRAVPVWSDGVESILGLPAAILPIRTPPPDRPSAPFAVTLCLLAAAWALRLRFSIAGTLLAVGFASAATIALINPPFQAADEATQFLRATQVARGGFVAVRGPDDGGGGRLPAALYRLAMSFEDLHFRVRAPLDPIRAHAAERIAWSGPRVWSSFANTAIYPPFFYIPQSVAIDLGRAFDLNIVTTMRLARLAVSLSATLAVAAAMLLAQTGAYLAAAILALPMTIALFGASGQDGPMIATAALTGAFMSRRRPASWISWLAAGFALGALGAARLPYIALASLPAVVAWRRPDRLRGLAAGALATLMALAWLHFGAGPVMFETHAGGSALTGGQMRFLVTHTASIGHIVTATLATNGLSYWHEFIGVLNWLDVSLPDWFYSSAGLILAALLGLSVVPGGSRQPAPPRLLIASVLALTTALIFAALYLSWTTVGAPVVDGVQGRYFIPVALMGMLLLPPTRAGWPRRLAVGLVALLLLADLTILPGLIEQHYRPG